MADLYHFATKEDSYANYFIHVSPRPGFRHLLSTAGAGGSSVGLSQLPSLPSGWGVSLSPQLLEIQADYHRRSLTSLDTALAELRDNHSQAGGDMGGQPHTPTVPCSGPVEKLHLALKGRREPGLSSEQGPSGLGLWGQVAAAAVSLGTFQESEGGEGPGLGRGSGQFKKCHGWFQTCVWTRV